MKSNIKVIILFLCMLSPIICISQYGQHGCAHTDKITQGYDVNCNFNPYMLIFEDNFDGNSLDLNKWDIIIGVPRDFDFNDQKAWHTPDNIIVENGVLKIITKREFMDNMTFVTNWGPPITTKTADFEFTSGEIWSKSRFPINGKFEARIKLPRSLGLWPAFWLYGEGYENYNEIDIFEVYNVKKDGKDNRHLNTNAHFSNTGGYNTKYDCMRTNLRHDDEWGNLTMDYLTSNFCTYTLVWDQDKIEWYINGSLLRIVPYYFAQTLWGLFGYTEYGYYCGSIKKGQKFRRYKFFPQYPMHIILNTAVRSPDSEENPDASVPFPAQMEVDYVRVYQRKPCNSNITINNSPLTNDYPLTGKILYRLITGNNVNLDCNIKIGPQHQMRVVAKNTVNFRDDFSIDVEDGGVFIAETKSNLCTSLKRIFIQNITPYDYVEAEDSIYDDSTVVYSRFQPLFIYPALDDSGLIIIDFRDNDYKDISLSIINEKNDIMYFKESIDEKRSFIDLSEFELGNYTLKLINSLTKREEIYNIEIIE